MSIGLARLKRRADFVRVAASRRRAVRHGMILQTAACPAADAGDTVRVGFTASRRVGNAVLRNRAKRRLRAAAAAVLAKGGRSGFDYVLIARAGTVTRDFGDLVGDLASALRQLERSGRDAGGGRRDGETADDARH